MSGIAGIVHWDGKPVQASQLEAMQSVLRHRGVDARGTSPACPVWRSESAGFVHLTSHVTRESSAEQRPYRSPTSGLVITADARLDNRDELLDALGIPDRHASDSAIILEAYEKWEADCPDHLLGDFAFVIWDPAQRQLFAARDPMGVRPFYYCNSADCFLFGSEIKAILEVSDAPRRLDETMVGDYFCHVFQDPEVTFYSEVRRLPAGCCLTLHAGYAELHEYWRLDPARELRFRSDGEYAEAFRAIFTESVRCRLRGEHPVGSTLSGGLDSSSIACTARDLLKASGQLPLPTFSAIFPGLPERYLAVIDERNYIDSVVAMGGIDAHYVAADRISPLADLDRVLRLYDEPVFAPNLYMHRALYGAARDRGVRVILDGLDGDTTVSHGFDYLAQLLLGGRWIALAKEAGGVSRRYPVTRANAIWRFAVRPSVPEPLVRGWRALRGRKPPQNPELAWLNADFAQRIGLGDRLHSLDGEQPLRPRSARQHHLDSIRSPLMTYALELADRSATAFSLEGRYPFFDRRLIEFSLALPMSQKLSDGWTRVVLRRAMEGVLPPQVQWRSTKGDLSPNFVYGLMQSERNTLERALLDDGRLIEPYVNLAALRQMFEKTVKAPRKSAADALTLFGVVMFSNWLREAKVSH